MINKYENNLFEVRKYIFFKNTNYSKNKRKKIIIMLNHEFYNNLLSILR